MKPPRNIKLWVLKSVYDGIFDSISDLGSIDDEIDIKVFKTNKDGETTVTEQQPADKKTKPKATKEAAKKPAATKPEEERFERYIFKQIIFVLANIRVFTITIQI